MCELFYLKKYFLESKDKQTLFYLKEYPDRIPDKPGNYFWYYYPNNLETSRLEKEELRKFFEEFSTKKLYHLIPFENPKFKISFQEHDFAKDKPLGLNSEKFELLIEFLTDKKSNYEYFVKFFKEICFSRPFYIGKAIKLRKRLKQHFEMQGGSEILEIIDKNKINYSDIYVEVDLLDFDYHEDISDIFEIIWQSKLKPGLVKKFG